MIAPDDAVPQARQGGAAARAWLTIDASGAASVVCLVRGGSVLAERRDAADEGRPGRLPALVAELLAQAQGIAVVVGPGSFTGLRAALALARGICDAGGPVAVGVTVGEAVFALDAAVAVVATAAGAGRVVLERGFPDPSFELAEGAAGPGATALGIARAAGLRASGAWPPRALLPVYATPPSAVLPREGRAAPA